MTDTLSPVETNEDHALETDEEVVTMEQLKKVMRERDQQLEQVTHRMREEIMATIRGDQPTAGGNPEPTVDRPANDVVTPAPHPEPTHPAEVPPEPTTALDHPEDHPAPQPHPAESHPEGHPAPHPEPEGAADTNAPEKQEKAGGNRFIAWTKRTGNKIGRGLKTLFWSAPRRAVRGVWQGTKTVVQAPAKGSYHLLRWWSNAIQGIGPDGKEIPPSKSVIGQLGQFARQAGAVTLGGAFVIGQLATGPWLAAPLLTLGAIGRRLEKRPAESPKK